MTHDVKLIFVCTVTEAQKIAEKELENEDVYRLNGGSESAFVPSRKLESTMYRNS